MASADTMYFTLSAVLVVLTYAALLYHIHDNHEQISQFAETQNLSSSKMTKRGLTTSEICVGRKCAAPPPRKSATAEFVFVSLHTSLCVLSIYMMLRFERRRAADRAVYPEHHESKRFAAQRFKRTAHSTSVPRSSLEPSPVPPAYGPRTARNRTAPRQNRSKIPWDRMAKSSDFEVCLSLHPTPLPSSCSSSTSGVYPCVPPRRWRGNSRLNLATSPEVVPNDFELYYHL